MRQEATIHRAVGALIEARPLVVGLHELVHVGPGELLGEVLRVDGDRATIQVFEETVGLALGMPVTATGSPLRVQLGPGLLGSVLDGIARPLHAVAQAQGRFIAPGQTLPTLPHDVRWTFAARVQPGAIVQGGDILGVVEEKPGRDHRILVPPEVRGTIAEIHSGDFLIEEPIGSLEDGTPLHLYQWWPVRRPRPAADREQRSIPFITGQRIFDLLFPAAVGGTIAVPGGFGTGKTVIEQTLAKYAEADIVVYIGCGERGNEMAEVLADFAELVDPRSGQSLLDRTVLIVNTSNMPVAARESSIYLGLTIAEYFRDMGYRVAVMADSLSRWAEALREVATRAQEMPGEEGYPTSLGNRVAALFERAGAVHTLGSDGRPGAVTFIAAVSPPGGDYSEPVTQATLRVAGALWALDPTLAHQRQFPAVDWESSYSLYTNVVASWFGEHVDARWSDTRTRLLTLLERDRELRDIVSLVGPEALEDVDRVILETAALTRQAVLGQSAFDPNDASSSIEKTYALARLTLEVYDRSLGAVRAGVTFTELELDPVRTALLGVRDASPNELPAAIAASELAIASMRETRGDA